MTSLSKATACPRLPDRAIPNKHLTRTSIIWNPYYYEAQTGRRLRDAQEADQAFRRRWEE